MDENAGCSAAQSPDLLILKLGGSILTGESDLALAVHEIYRHVRIGTKVIAIVSAVHGATDRLLARAKRLSDNPDPLTLATLLSTGELTSAALLSLALDRAGIPARILDSTQIQLRSTGPTLDATPTSVNTNTIRAALNQHAVLIIPGFIARDENNNPTLLGRGGSDLTALFLAKKLGAEARLLKDVPGIFESDPNSCSPSLREGVGGRELETNGATSNSHVLPRRYSTLSWSDLENLGAKIVQPRTAIFARENQVPFEVGAILSDDVTIVGNVPTHLDSGLRTKDSGPPLRISLLGHGTVGAGVARAIRRLPDLFTLTSVAVRDPEKHVSQPVPPTQRPSNTSTPQTPESRPFSRCPSTPTLPRHLLTTNPFAAIETDADIVIELIGGIEPARTLIAQYLASGKHVITANKAVIAQHGEDLRALANANGVQLLYSAAVGGSLPILETARRLAPELVSIEAILNGATNYILTRLDHGASLPTAIAEAQLRGLTESDPTRDLSGQDALDKLTVIAQDLWPDLPIHSTRIPSTPSPQTRQIARLTKTPNFIQLQVAFETPSPQLSNCAYENNAAIFTTADGHQTVISGKGAGRHPTTESVLADLLDLAQTPALTSASY